MNGLYDNEGVKFDKFGIRINQSDIVTDKEGREYEVVQTLIPGVLLRWLKEPEANAILCHEPETLEVSKRTLLLRRLGWGMVSDGEWEHEQDIAAMLCQAMDKAAKSAGCIVSLPAIKENSGKKALISNDLITISQDGQDGEIKFSFHLFSPDFIHRCKRATNGEWREDKFIEELTAVFSQLFRASLSSIDIVRPICRDDQAKFTY